MTIYAGEGEHPALGPFTHHEPPLSIELTRSDLAESGRQKLVAALTDLGVDVNYVTGVLVSGVIVYELDKAGHYVTNEKELVTKTIML